MLLFVPNLLYAIALEVYFFVGGNNSRSWFFDRPLSEKGAKQAKGLIKFIPKERMSPGSSPGKIREEKAVKLLLALGEENEEGGPSSVGVLSISETPFPPRPSDWRIDLPPSQGHIKIEGKI